jgi:mRNA-degrading endonuclease HigB of HigAB toxin-antitoxin module
MSLVFSSMLEAVEQDLFKQNIYSNSQWITNVSCNQLNIIYHAKYGIFIRPLACKENNVQKL